MQSVIIPVVPAVDKAAATVDVSHKKISAVLSVSSATIALLQAAGAYTFYSIRQTHKHDTQLKGALNTVIIILAVSATFRAFSALLWFLNRRLQIVNMLSGKMLFFTLLLIPTYASAFVLGSAIPGATVIDLYHKSDMNIKLSTIISAFPLLLTIIEIFYIHLANTQSVYKSMSRVKLSMAFGVSAFLLLMTTLALQCYSMYLARSGSPPPLKTVEVLDAFAVFTTFWALIYYIVKSFWTWADTSLSGNAIFVSLMTASWLALAFNYAICTSKVGLVNTGQTPTIVMAAFITQLIALVLLHVAGFLRF